MRIVRVGCGHQAGDPAAMPRHLDYLPVLGQIQVLAGVLLKLTHANLHRHHVYGVVQKYVKMPGSFAELRGAVPVRVRGPEGGGYRANRYGRYERP